MSEESSKLKTINTTIVFSSAFLAAMGITLYILFGQRDMIINGENSKFTEEKLYRLGILASGIFLIGLIYFEILAIEQYNKTKSEDDANYLTAATLSLTAQIIRFFTLYNSKNDSEVNAEDILP